MSLSKLILSSFRSKDKQTAIMLWKNRLNWGWQGNELADAVEASRFNEGPAFHLINFGGARNAAIDDVGHLSVFRALGRHKVADHWVSMLKREGIPRPWLMDDSIAHVGHVEHQGFWEVLAEKLDTEGLNKHWSYVLDTAACAGNLVPFQVCPKETLVAQAQNMATWGTAPARGLVHPDVATWLVAEQLWDDNVLVRQVSHEHFPMDGSLQRFMGLTHGVQCESSYVQQLCVGVLQKYPLTTPNKIRFVAQAMMSFNPEDWEKFLEPVIKPHLEGIDLAVLKAVSGQSTFCQIPGEKELLDTLYKATQAAMYPFNEEHANTGMRNGPSQHEGLLLLMDVAPPRNRLELYYLGERAMRIERGVEPVAEVWQLPTLE